MMAVVDEGFTHLLRSLQTKVVSAESADLRKMADEIVTAAWAAFSTPTSMAALEILIATRASRGPDATRHLAELGTALSRLGRQIGRGLRSSHAGAVGNLLWAAMRGMVMAQMVVRDPIDTTRDRRELVNVIVSYIEQHQK